MAHLLVTLAAQLKVWEEAYEIIDGLPIPVANPSRGRLRKCFTDEEANLGRGGVGKGWYYGVCLLGCVTASGVMTGFVTSPAGTNEHWLANALFSWRHDSRAILIDMEITASARKHGRQITGPAGHHLSPTTAGIAVTDLYLADQGFQGTVWQVTWKTRCGATVMTQHDLGRPDRRRFHRDRRCFETVFAILTNVLHIKYPKARTEAGLVTHLVTSCIALNLGIYLNRLFGRPDFAIGTLFRG